MCLNAPFQNQHPLFLLPSFFSRIFQHSGQDQQNSKQCQLPPWSFKNKVKDTFSNTSIDLLRALFLSRISVGFSVKPAYLTMVGEMFQI